MDYSDLIISKDATMISALQQMDAQGKKVLLVFDGSVFVSIITIGAIQRAIIKHYDLNEPISSIVSTTGMLYGYVTDTKDAIKEKMRKICAQIMPIIDENNNLVDVYTWVELFGDEEQKCNPSINLPVVVMAGGKGTRLAPLTNIYPKPLIPIGEKTIVECIMDKFVSYNCHNFYISVNYKAETIKNYFRFINNAEYNIHYFQEDKPMGTAGSLRLLKNTLTSTFFVSNCDILINEDYSEILKYHRENKNELTVVAAIKTLSIPYGTIITGENGLLESIEEKPTLSLKINTGFYILEPSLLEDIPDDFYHITNLIEKLIAQRRRVGVYPICQNDWQDMGDWEEYLKIIRK